MRIIDKNTDFYDFWQNVYRDNSLTFDRTDSYLLKKDAFLNYLSIALNHRWLHGDDHICVFLLMQIGNTFWLILVEVTKISQDYWTPKDYTMELVATWKNYDKPRRLISLDFIQFDMSVGSMILCDGARNGYGYDKSKILSRKDTLINAVNWNTYKVKKNIGDYAFYKNCNEKETKHIPIMKACGIAGIVDSHEVYLAFEEFFSLEKTASERTESIGLTDTEKIGNHGFDVRTSFRGK